MPTLVDVDAIVEPSVTGLSRDRNALEEASEAGAIDEAAGGSQILIGR